jgi:hypothetical protein
VTAPTPGLATLDRPRRYRIREVRTYSHAVFSLYAARHLAPEQPDVAAWTVLGATLPDFPALAGAAWLGARRRRRFTRQEFCEEACERGPFGVPDSALHSALPVALLLAVRLASGAMECRSKALLLGWAGHVLADALSHARDARPILWPVSERRFASPVSYWDHAHHALPFTLIEHAALLLLAARCAAAAKS